MKPNLFRRLTASLMVIILLLVGLCVTTFALVMSILTVEDNLFLTGSVSINLNDGKKVIDESEFLFEPGITVQKTFFVKNESPIPVYYRLYFEDIRGGLAKVLDVTIRDDQDQVLYSGKMADLTRQNIATSDYILRSGQKKDLTITFHFPTTCGNDTQGLYLVFNLCAEAVQTRNNPTGVFE